MFEKHFSFLVHIRLSAKLTLKMIFLVAEFACYSVLRRHISNHNSEMLRMSVITAEVSIPESKTDFMIKMICTTLQLLVKNT